MKNILTIRESWSIGVRMRIRKIKLGRWFGTDHEGFGSVGKEAYIFPCEHGEKACSMVLKAPLNANGKSVKPSHLGERHLYTI